MDACLCMRERGLTKSQAIKIANDRNAWRCFVRGHIRVLLPRDKPWLTTGRGACGTPFI